MSDKSVLKIGVFSFLLIVFGLSFLSSFSNVLSFLEDVSSSEEYTLVLGEKIEIKEIPSVEAPLIEETNQFSDEKFEFYSEEDGKLKNRETIYWIVLSGLILLFLVLLSYIIYLLFNK